ncbi:arginase family protein [Agrobacterium rubi]|uniref:arginase family protein n=1 Tax=Agrobacterium rubi TaxID=28099 RepID=UPI0015716D0E|nr:arginase family protein [Agrobacterium rubi]NTF10880.1 arginase family protein [Agrobacterium rubi]NTF23254.1 arginase family protein [Agrobacterium rubi]NTF30216.1 arginase family protein [Agrobacterium rubi]
MRIILAPSNLGLSPLKPDHEPGTWRAPMVLMEAGLRELLAPSKVISLKRPAYSLEAQHGTRLRNGSQMRSFNLALADDVDQAVREGDFTLVLGGDCSILLGALAGARRHGSLSLLHIDGHSDFRHPGNYDADAMLGAAAGMDLAMATGKGEALAVEWPGITGPLVNEHDVIQLGERENRDHDFAWPDVNRTDIERIDVFEARQIGSSAVLDKITQRLAVSSNRGFWVHFDVDVLDQKIMPAVDCPGSPGLDVEDLVHILSRCVSDPACLGMTVTVFDPDLDSDGRYAKVIVDILSHLPFR